MVRVASACAASPLGVVGWNCSWIDLAGRRPVGWRCTRYLQPAVSVMIQEAIKAKKSIVDNEKRPISPEIFVLSILSFNCINFADMNYKFCLLIEHSLSIKIQKICKIKAIWAPWLAKVHLDNKRAVSYTPAPVKSYPSLILGISPNIIIKTCDQSKKDYNYIKLISNPWLIDILEILKYKLHYQIKNVFQ